MNNLSLTRFEIIPITPRHDCGGIPADRDAPTVAEVFLPTEKISPEPVYKTYGELWRAWAHSTAAYPEM